MRTLATPTGLLLALTLLAAPAAHAQPAASQTITTSTVTTKVFNNGITQGDCTTGPFFTFNGVEGGCGAGFLVGISASNVIGDAYILDATTGWTPGTIGASTDFPYATLTSGVRATFANATEGVSVEANHYYSETNPDFVVHHYEITNTGSTALNDVYPGHFWDFDVAGGAAASNSAAYDATNQLISVWHTPNPAALYYGVAALTGTVSGFRYDMPYPSAAGQPHLDTDLYAGLTVSQGATSAPRDQRGTLGVGPYDIPAGGSITVVFASLGGTNQADLLANAAAARAAVAPPAGPPIHDTGVVMLEILEDGLIGQDGAAVPPVGLGFTYAGENALYEGQLIVAVPGQITGIPYTSSATSAAPPQWTTTVGPAAIAPPVGFTQAFQTTFVETPEAPPIGIEVTQRSYSGTGDGYVIVEYTIENTTAATIPTFYAGLFTDWDVSAAYEQNRGGYDATTQLLYAYNGTATGTQNYYGVAPLASNAEGVSGYGFDVTQDEGLLFNALTATQAVPTAGADRRHLIGSGPYSIAAGQSVVVRFAIVGGANLAGIVANAALAQAEFPVAGEEGPTASAVRLDAARPNPVATSAALRYTLAEPAQVTLAVYDALGRRVALLADGLVGAGEHPVVWDASALPSGVYLLRLTAGATQVTRPVTIAR